MNVFTGKHEGNLTVRDPLGLKGMVVGDVRAVDGAKIRIDGMITQDLHVYAGADVAIHGMVNGHMIVHGGEVSLFGHTTSVQKLSDDATVYIDDNAIVGND